MFIFDSFLLKFDSCLSMLTTFQGAISMRFSISIWHRKVPAYVRDAAFLRHWVGLTPTYFRKLRL